jgi:hypothetical protein
VVVVTTSVTEPPLVLPELPPSDPLLRLVPPSLDPLL